MSIKKQKLELTWIGKGDEPKLEPRILLENPEYSYGDPASGNMLIHGDNLLALKALEQDYAGKIKCIYIDPPYNTGSAFEHYEDGIEHSQWLNLMAPRIRLLKNLLSENGLIWISIDDNECHYLKVQCDEIFGRNNFLANFIWKKSYGGGAKSKWFVGLHEHILVYSKNIEKLPELFLPPDPEAVSKYYKFQDEKFQERGPYRLQPLATTSMDSRPNLRYPIMYKETEIWPEKQWQWSKERVETALLNNTIVFNDKNGKISVSYKQYLKDEDGNERNRKPNTIIDGFYTQHGTYESMALFGTEEKFSFPKPEGLLQNIIETSSTKGDIILDSFSGSGTTAAVAHKMGRKWIGIELGAHAQTHCQPRLKAVVDGEQGGISKTVNWQGGGGFRFYTLAPSLLNQDRFGNWIISSEYNATMLAAAMAKQEGFRYLPHQNSYWQQGRSSEKDFIYTTTQFITVELLDKIHDEMQPDENLLITCKAYQAGCENRHSNISLKKIPHALLGRCEFGKDDYSLNIVNLPPDEDAPPWVAPRPHTSPAANKANGKNKKKTDNNKDQITLL